MHPTLCKQFLIDGCVKAVSHQFCIGVECLNLWQNGNGHTRCSVHGEMERDHFRLGGNGSGEWRYGKVQASYLMTAIAQPGRRGCESERLATHFISGY